jgi:hypothetical protein
MSFSKLKEDIRRTIENIYILTINTIFLLIFYLKVFHYLTKLNYDL